MKTFKRIVGLLLAMVMIVALAVPVSAEESGETPTTDTGSITLSNATIGESYHIYKLFDVSYGATEENGKIPTEYFATPEQKEALEKIDGNVFAFAYQEEDKNYQVTVAIDSTTNSPYTEQQVIDFINSFIRTLSGGVTACGFPGAEEVTGNGNTGIGEDKVATASTITWKDVPYGYYFVTSSLGAVVSVSTSNPNAEIKDKNPDNPDWNNEPDEPEPDGPVKDVLNADNKSIDGEQVEVGQTLTYSISYTNKEPEGEGKKADVLDSLTITDEAPEGTTYVANSATSTRSESGKAEPTIVEADGKITWTFEDVAIGETVAVQFKVKVTDDALTIETKTVENEADATVKIGPNTYDLKTNKVENPVEDPDDPVKDVLNDEEISIDGQKVAVSTSETPSYLTYKISYTNNKTTPLDSVVIKDAAPTGTVYKADSARGERSTDGTDAVISVGADGTITWTFASVAADETVTAYFKVKVTEAALSITDKTIVNTATVKVDNDSEIETNEVTNPVGDKPDDPNPGKVIVNPDGSETTTSTGSFGDTVTFDIGVNAVNQVKKAENSDETVQVKKYYIYDQMDPGFTLDETTMAVTINGIKYMAEKDNPQSVEGVTTYTISNVGTLFTSVTANGNTLIEATIPWVDSDNNALYPNCKLHLTYNATINEEAVIADTGNLNRVFYDYSTVVDENPTEPDPEHPQYPDGTDLNHGSEEKKTTTYTYALGLQKYSAETGEPLAGAEFTATDAGGNPIYAVPVEVDGMITHYNYTTEQPDPDTPAAPNAPVNTFITNADGQIIIKGVDIGSYTFKETEAPKGYNLLAEPVTVEAQMDSTTEKYNKTDWTVTRTFEAITKEEFEAGYTGDMYTKSDDEGKSVFTLVADENKPTAWDDAWNDSAVYYKLTGSSATDEERVEGSTTITFPVNVAKLEVENHAGSELPGTGGIGTTIFYVIGAILVLAAVVLLVTKKRMNSAK